MKSKASLDFFLLSKVLITANNMRADINKVENSLRTLGYDDKEAFRLLDAMRVSADLVHSIINDEHNALCEHFDSCIDSCASGVRFDSEADNDADEEDTPVSSQKLLHCKFVAGHWYCAKQRGRTTFLRVVSRDNYNALFLSGIVRDHGKDSQVKVRVHTNQNRRWLGEPTEYVTVYLDGAYEPGTVISSANWVPREEAFGDQ